MDELLIELVREHGVIYNHGLPDYRDQHIRQAAWEEIGMQLQISGDSAKKRWDKLRRCLWNARNRRREDTKSGMSSRKKSSWKFEHQMSFIIPFLETRKAQSLKESPATVNLAAKQEDQSEGSDSEEHHQLEKNDVDGLEKAAEDAVTCNDEENVEQVYETAQQNSKQKCNDNPTQQMVQILKERLALKKRQFKEISSREAPKTSSLLETLDSTDMFFLSMSKMTKQLPKGDQAQIKLALSNSVLSAEIRCNQQTFS